MSTEVLTRICNVFLGTDDFQPEEYEHIISSLPAEISNIVCGLAISDFQELDDELTMSEPILFDKKIISNLAKNNNAISNIIETIYGNFICTIINISKE
jgi:chemotaxis protein CheY-P-specific phosphatase CheC